jgi:hypothetical protein
MNTSQAPSKETLDIAGMVKQANEAYLTAYRVGYSAGWESAMSHSFKVIRGPDPEKGLSL